MEGLNPNLFVIGLFAYIAAAIAFSSALAVAMVAAGLATFGDKRSPWPKRLAWLGVKLVALSLVFVAAGFASFLSAPR